MRKSIVLALLGILLGGIKHLIGQESNSYVYMYDDPNVDLMIQGYNQFEINSYIFEPGDVKSTRYATVFDKLEKNTESNHTVGNEARSIVNVYDGAYRRYTGIEAVPLNYNNIREADVAWVKRLWREIDIREKQNAHFANAEMPLVEVFMQLLAANPQNQIFYADEKFTQPITYDEVIAKLKLADTLQILNESTFNYDTKVVTNDPNYAQFHKFRLKEDWLLDSRTSALTQRVIGIAPIREVFNKDNEFIGVEPLFWIYYPNAREYMSKVESFNPFNDAIRMSWTDVIDMRYFSSIITKESNNSDRRISDYADGRNALLESKRLTEKIFNFEHDLWEW